MTKQESEKKRELRFVCPECGANSLCSEASGYLNIDHVYENGVFTWGDMRPEEISEYFCRECGYELEFEEDEGIVEWLIAHCDQEFDNSCNPGPDVCPMTKDIRCAGHHSPSTGAADRFRCMSKGALRSSSCRRCVVQ